MQYDTNFKSRLSNLYTECQRPLLEAAMPDAGSFLGVGTARMLASKRMIITLPLIWLHPAALSPSLSLCLQCYPVFPKMQKVEVYCGIITTHLVVSERLAGDGLSMQ